MRWLHVLLIVFATGVAVRATTVVPPTFDELVLQSELVFRGRVTEVSARWVGEGPRQRIVTRVSFVVERALRGEAKETLELEFLGGELGGRAFRLSGWPTFAVGDRGVFFVENRRGRVCPLVRLRHGRYRVIGEATSGKEHVLRDDFTPLRVVSDVVKPLAERAVARSAESAAGLTLAGFEAQILERSAALPGTPVSSR